MTSVDSRHNPFCFAKWEVWAEPDIRALFTPKLLLTSFESGIGNNGGILCCVSSFLTRTSLPKGQGSIDEQQSRRDFRPKKYAIAMGCAVFLCGVVLISKVLNKVYFSPGFNVNVAVGVFLLGGIMVSGGCLLILAFVFP
jgi:hypothetical protein